MARNWDTASKGGLNTLIDAYHAGVDRNNALEDRDRQWGQTTLKNEQDQALHDPYDKIKRDAQGSPVGLEENLEYQRRDQKPAATRFPEMFKRPGQPAPAAQSQADPQSPMQPAQNDARGQSQAPSPSGRPMGETYDEYQGGGDRQPQGRTTNDPEPLLKDPKAAQVDAQLKSKERQNVATNDARGKIEEKRLESGKRAMVGAGTKSVEYDKNDPGIPSGVNAQGIPQRTVNATKTVQQFDNGVNVLGGANASDTRMIPGAQRLAALEDPGEDYNPTPYMRKRLTDAATTVPRYSQTQTVALASLPAGLRKKLGIPDDSKEVIPSDILKAWLGGEYKLAGGAGGGKNLPPEVLPFIQDVESGVADSADSLSAFNQAHPGIPITPEVARAFTQSKGLNYRGEGMDRADARAKVVDSRVGRKEYLGIVGNASNQWKKAADEILTETSYARTAKALVNQKDTKGVVGAVQMMMARAGSEKGPLSRDDLSRTPGAEDWFDVAEQFVSKASGEGMTPQNIKIVNRIADLYIKAAQDKAKALSRPIVGGLRARSRAYGLDPNEAENLFREEVDMEISGPGGSPAAPTKGSGQAKIGGGDLKAKYQAGLKAADDKYAKNPVERRKARAELFKMYQSMGGK